MKWAKGLCLVVLADFAYEFLGGFEGVFARDPVGRADFLRMGGRVDVGFELAEQFLGAAGHIVIGDLAGNQDTLRVDDKGSAQSQTGFLIIHAEEFGEFAGGISGHREGDVGQQFFGLLPGQLDKFSVGGNGDDFRALFAESRVVGSHIGQFRGADKGERCREENQYGPFAGFPQFFQGDSAERGIFGRPGLCLKIGHGVAQLYDDVIAVAAITAVTAAIAAAVITTAAFVTAGAFFAVLASAVAIRTASAATAALFITGAFFTFVAAAGAIGTAFAGFLCFL